MKQSFRELLELLIPLMNGEEENWDNVQDFPAVVAEAKKQAVGGLLYMVKTVPTDKMERLERLRWLGSRVTYENVNEGMNRKVASLSKAYDDAGICYAIMKGQVCATNYPQPELRNCGDIDVYVIDNDFDRACKILEEKGMHKTDYTQLHATYKQDKLIIEVHFAIQNLQWLPAFRRLQRITKEEMSGPIVTVPIGGYDVRVLPTELNMVLLTLHALNHTISGGLGLRHVLDWQETLKKSETIDTQKLVKMLRELHLWNMWRVLLYISTQTLDCKALQAKAGSSELFTLSFTKKEKALAADLLAWIEMAGNFGKTLDLGKGKQRFFRYYWLFIKNCIRFFRLCPTEMSAWPFMKLYRAAFGKNHQDFD